VNGHRRLGQSFFHLGALSAARTHLEQAIALHYPHQSPTVDLSGGRDYDVYARNIISVALWLLGYPEQAKERSQEALTLARERANPNTLANTLVWAAWLHQCLREGPLAQERAEAYGHLGQTAEGLGAIAEALAFVHTTGERSWEAELYRLQGELLRLGEEEQERGRVEECFCQALEIARRQQAKSLELRAAMSLARLWQRQGKRAEARELLAAIYGWFTEGFDTADLQEAKACLETSRNGVRVTPGDCHKTVSMKYERSGSAHGDHH
jgi:tetratricopeptide (TPR) repeat protein